MDLVYYIHDFKRIQATTLVNLKRTIGSKGNAICSDADFMQVKNEIRLVKTNTNLMSFKAWISLSSV
jgi:hypothetical protein